MKRYERENKISNNPIDIFHILKRREEKFKEIND